MPDKSFLNFLGVIRMGSFATYLKVLQNGLQKENRRNRSQNNIVTTAV